MANIIDSTLIRITRAKAGLSQGQLAGEVGCARNTICRAESGECSVSLATRIARRFKKPDDFFIRHTVPTTEPNGIQVAPLNDKQRYVLSMMQRSPRATFFVWEAAVLMEKLLDRSSDEQF